MSKGNSIFSSPNGSNGEAPANPFASLGGGQSKGGASSPFAAVTPSEPESPFGFAADEESAPDSPQSKLPEKRMKAPMPAAEDNPFASSTPAPKQQPTEPKEGAPFTAESSFEAPAKSTPQSQPVEPPSNFGGLDNPLSGLAQESAKPASQPVDPAQSTQSTAVPPVLASTGQSASASPLQQSAASAASSSAASAFSSQPASAASSPAPAGAQSTRQLELRAIFGSEGEMTRDEILTRAKALPGIRELTVVGAGETAAIQTMGDVMTRFGFGGADSWQMTCSGGVVDFVTSENTTLAVLREGRYPAGVWETLMIVARELGKLS